VETTFISFSEGPVVPKPPTTPPPRIFGFGFYFGGINAFVGKRKIVRIAQHVTLGWYAWNNKQRSVQPHLVYTEEINALYRHMASLCPPIGCDRCHFVQS